MMCSIFSILRYCTNNTWYNRAVTYSVDNFLADRIAYRPVKISEDRASPLKVTRQLHEVISQTQNSLPVPTRKSRTYVLFTVLQLLSPERGQ